ncbi:MAG: toll/interleukin-1 receptor domain-containing protein [bacterium]|nr:toll/interleukin-1 receptor domain-containing protein [bacterium]
MTRVFISYRRSDTEYIAAMLHYACVAAFDEESVFKDTESIASGADFTRSIQSYVDKCNAMLVLIGNEWLSTKDSAGERRLFKEDDWVRKEVEAGLASDEMQVIPVLVQGAVMPSADELPPSLKELAKRNAVTVRAAELGEDLEELVHSIHRTYVHVHLKDRDGKTVDPDGIYLFPRNDLVHEEHGRHIDKDTGAYKISVNPGEYELVVYPPKGESIARTIKAESGDNHMAVGVGVSSHVLLEVQNRAGEPIEPAGMFVLDQDERDFAPLDHDDCRTGDGTFEIEVIPGSYTVVVKDEDDNEIRQEVVVAADEGVPVRLVLG